MISLITGIMGGVIALIIVWVIRFDHLHIRHSIGWLGIAGVFALLGFAPAIVNTVARAVGIAYPPALAFAIGIGVIFVKLLTQDITASKLQIRHQRLVQKIAVLETEIRRIRQKEKTNQSKEVGESSETQPSVSEPEKP